MNAPANQTLSLMRFIGAAWGPTEADQLRARLFESIAREAQLRADLARAVAKQKEMISGARRLLAEHRGELAVTAPRRRAR